MGCRAVARATSASQMEMRTSRGVLGGDSADMVAVEFGFGQRQALWSVVI